MRVILFNCCKPESIELRTTSFPGITFNSASKAAYLALLLKNEIYHVGRFDPKVDLRELVIENKDFIKFRTILKFDPEAYYYWYKCVEIINDKP